MTIFSTQQTLSSPLVAQWVQTEAIDTLALWLASGHPHPRLATEAIAHAVGQGKVAIANMVWQAGWHKPTLVFEDSWRQLRQHHYGAMLDHGLKPGGSVWVGAMEKEDAGPLFENLLNRADTLTSPRQRLTILLYAQHQGVLQERWDHLLPVFMDLGVPAEVRLSPSELKRATTAEQRLAIAAGDSAHDARSWLKQYYHRQPLFEQESIAFQEPLRSDIYNHYRHQKLEDTLPTAAPKKATPRF